MIKNLIKDKTIGTKESDSFGIHSRIADTIATIINNKKFEEIQIMGLIGARGSGKSSIIEMLKRSFGNEKYFFIFDAWEHQGEPPKRAFIESFLSFIKGSNIKIDDDNLVEDIDFLSGAKEKSKTINNVKLNNWEIALIIITIFMPIFLTLSRQNWPDKYKWLQCVGYVGLATLPLFFLVRIIYNCQNGYKIRDAFNFFVNKSAVTHTTKHKLPDATIIEFKKTYNTLLKKLDKDTIIVIDNLDRVDHDNITDIWSVFSSLTPNNEDFANKKRTCIIVPLDESIIESVYKEGTQSFIEKSFDITFNVTTPILSDWINYLSDQLKAVFTEIDEKEISDIKDVLDTDENITPRYLNSFVNKLAVLYMQFDHTIDKISIAHYLVKEKDIKENIYVFLTKGDYPEKISKEIAALYYGVKPDKAYQILIDRALPSIIKNCDIKKWEGIISIHGASANIHSYILHSDELTHEHIINLAYLTSTIEVSSYYTKSHVDNLVQLLPEKLSEVRIYEKLNEKNLDKHIAGIDILFSSNNDIIESLLKDFDESVLVSPNLWIHCANKFQQKISVPEYIDFEYVVLNINNPKRINTTLKNLDIVQRLSNKIEDQIDTKKLVEFLVALENTNLEISKEAYSPFIEKLNKLLESRKETHIALLLEVFIVLYKKDKLFLSNVAINQLSRLVESAKEKALLLAMVVLNGIRNTDNVDVKKFVESIDDVQVVDEVINIFSKYPNYNADFMFSLINNEIYKNLSGKVYVQRLAKNSLGSIHLLNTLKLFAKVCKFHPSIKEDFANALSSYETFWEEISKVDESIQLDLMESLDKTEEKSDYLYSFLNNKNIEWWGDNFKQISGWIHLLLNELSEKDGAKHELGSPVKEALILHSNSLLNGEVTIEEDDIKKNWNKILTILPEELREAFADKILDNLSNHISENISQKEFPEILDIFELYGEILFLSEAFKNNRDRYIRDVINKLPITDQRVQDFLLTCNINFAFIGKVVLDELKYNIKEKIDDDEIKEKLLAKLSS